MWLVSRVHDRTLEGGLQTDLFLEEVGALAQLERNVAGNRARRLTSHLACASKHLSRNEVRGDL